MRHPIRYFAPSVCAFMSLFAGAVQAPAQESVREAEAAASVVVRTSEEFHLKEHQGYYVALHFLADPAAPDEMEYVRMIADRWPEHAGFKHVFVKQGDAATAESWGAALAEAELLPVNGPLEFVVDLDRKIASAVQLAQNKTDPADIFQPAAIALLNKLGTPNTTTYASGKATSIAAHLYDQVFDHFNDHKALKEYNLSEGNLALQSYDLVSYHSGTPRKGRAGFDSKYDGIVYRFGNEANREAFARDPQKYLPTYGGWCATAMADEDKVEIDPENYKITKGRLFLFYNGFWGNALKAWNKDEVALTRKADAAWKRISGE